MVLDVPTADKIPLVTRGATDDFNRVYSTLAEMAGNWVTNKKFAGGADSTGSLDSTAAITACELAMAPFGAKVIFPAGTYKTTGLIKQAATIWDGAGRFNTKILLANGANTDVIKGANFDSLTLSGAHAGIGGWGIRDMTIDGNKANQTGTSYGLRVYGYNFDLTGVSIKNCLTDPLYTEWSSFAGFATGDPDNAMEARFSGLKLHDSNGLGWHNRGPHDSRAWDVTIDGCGAGNPLYWGEGAAAGTVAAGSNGVDVSTFTGSGTLNISTTLNYPAASISATQGSITITGLTGGTGTCVITYTAKTGNTFTGCTTVSGSGVLATGNPCSMTGGGYSSAGMQMEAVHTYGGSASWGYILDAPTHMIDCIAEVATTGMVLVRNNCEIIGGLYFVAGGATQTGCGIQLGDTINGVGGCYIRTQINRLACTSAATAALNIVNDATGNDIEISANAASGSVVWSGSMLTGSHYAVRAVGQATNANAVNSRKWDAGNVVQHIPTATGTAWAINDLATGDIVNINTNSGTKEVGIVNGYWIRLYSDNYSTATMQLEGSTGHISSYSGTSGALNPGIASNAGSTGAAVTSHSSDLAGKITATTVAAPGVLDLLTVTFKNAFANAPSIKLTPTTLAAALMSVYCKVTATGFTISSAQAPPAGADSAAVGWDYQTIGQL